MYGGAGACQHRGKVAGWPGTKVAAGQVGQDTVGQVLEGPAGYGLEQANLCK